MELATATASTDTRRQTLRRNLPGLANAAVTFIIVLVVAQIALLSRSDAPPTIAEFAPQAQNPIKQPPGQLSSDFGTGNGSGGGGTPGTASPSPSPGSPSSQIDRQAVLKCVGDPPRQIEDPQSPPCIAYWTGNNGGATSPGISGDTITIAAYAEDDPDFNLLLRR